MGTLVLFVLPASLLGLLLCWSAPPIIAFPAAILFVVGVFTSIIYLLLDPFGEFRK